MARDSSLGGTGTRWRGGDGGGGSGIRVEVVDHRRCG